MLSLDLPFIRRFHHDLVAHGRPSLSPSFCFEASLYLYLNVKTPLTLHIDQFVLMKQRSDSHPSSRACMLYACTRLACMPPDTSLYSYSYVGYTHSLSLCLHGRYTECHRGWSSIQWLSNYIILLKRCHPIIAITILVRCGIPIAKRLARTHTLRSRLLRC